METEVRNLLTEKALLAEYRRLVAGRLGKNRWLGRVPEKLLQRTAERLCDPRIAGIYIRAQFARMPSEWCMMKFRKPYPPSNVVFGKTGYEKYEEYLSRGVDDAS